MSRTGQETETSSPEKPPLRMVVTGGGTVAPIDDVRVLTNVSSGRFSAEITEAALRRGAIVWHIHAPSALLPFDRLGKVDLNAPDFDAELLRVQRLQNEWDRVKGRLHLKPFPPGTVAAYASTLREVIGTVKPDVIVLAMAVSDFEPEPVAGKIDSSRNTLNLTLRRTPKVIQNVRDWSPSSFLVGFKLLSGVDESALIATARRAMATNRADLVVANDLQTYRRGEHTIHLVRSGETVETLGPGGSPAQGLVDRIVLWARARGNNPS